MGNWKEKILQPCHWELQQALWDLMGMSLLWCHCGTPGFNKNGCSYIMILSWSPYIHLQRGSPGFQGWKRHATVSFKRFATNPCFPLGFPWKRKILVLSKNRENNLSGSLRHWDILRQITNIVHVPTMTHLIPRGLLRKSIQQDAAPVVIPQHRRSKAAMKEAHEAPVGVGHGPHADENADFSWDLFVTFCDQFLLKMEENDDQPNMFCDFDLDKMEKWFRSSCFCVKSLKSRFIKKHKVGEKPWFVIVFTSTTPMNCGVFEGDCHRVALSRWPSTASH